MYSNGRNPTLTSGRACSNEKIVAKYRANGCPHDCQFDLSAATININASSSRGCKINNFTAANENSIPDSYGSNIYEVDPEFRRLLNIYLDRAVFSHVEPQFKRMGALAGAELETLALAADVNPPVLRTRSRIGRQIDDIEKHPSYVKLERYAYGEFGLAAMSHRGGVFGWNEKMPPLVKYGLTMLFVQAEFGLCVVR